MARNGRSGRLGRRERQPEPGNTPQNRLKATHSNHRATATAQSAKPTTRDPTLDEESAVAGERRHVSTSGWDDDDGDDESVLTTQSASKTAENRSRYGQVFTKEQ